MRQGPNKSPNQFYEKIMGILNCISNHIEVHTQKQTNYFANKPTFLTRIREPIWFRIRTTADIQYIQEENNIRYAQKSYHQNETLLNGRPTHNIQTPRHYIYQQQQAYTQSPQFQLALAAPLPWQQQAFKPPQPMATPMRYTNLQPLFGSSFQNYQKPLFNQPITYLDHRNKTIGHQDLAHRDNPNQHL